MLGEHEGDNSIDPTNIDVIGDIHGHADALEALLLKLGYRDRSGAWRHPGRTAVFVGDFIDRGPAQLRTLGLVRDMVEAGTGRAVMGNHELNAMAWAMERPNGGGHLRTRDGAKGAKHRAQHAAFLQEVGEDSPLHREWIDWFATLPMWIETPAWRVVHACWHPALAQALKPRLTVEGRLTEDLLLDAHDPAQPEFQAVDTLLKGPEAALPAGAAFVDKDGHRREAIRLRWWRPEARTYREAYIGPDGVEIPDHPLPAGVALPPVDRPTFIGHYWFDPDAPYAPAAPQVACVDYSAARSKRLVAYRFDGDPALSADRFVTAGAAIR